MSKFCLFIFKPNSHTYLKNIHQHVMHFLEEILGDLHGERRGHSNKTGSLGRDGVGNRFKQGLRGKLRKTILIIVIPLF